MTLGTVRLRCPPRLAGRANAPKPAKVAELADALA